MFQYEIFILASWPNTVQKKDWAREKQELICFLSQVSFSSNPLVSYDSSASL